MVRRRAQIGDFVAGGLAVWGLVLAVLLAQGTIDRILLASLALVIGTQAVLAANRLRRTTPHRTAVSAKSARSVGKLAALLYPVLAIACALRLQDRPGDALAAYYFAAGMWCAWMTFAMLVLVMVFWVLKQIRN